MNSQINSSYNSEVSIKHTTSNETNVQLNYSSQLSNTPSKKQTFQNDVFTKIVNKDEIKSEFKYQHNPGYSMQQQYQQPPHEIQQLQKKLADKEMQLEQEKQSYQVLFRYLESNKLTSEFSYFNQQIQQIKEKEDRIHNQNLLLKHYEDQLKQQSDKFQNYICQQNKFSQQSLLSNKNLESKLQEIESQYETKQQEYSSLESDFEIAKQQSIKQQEESVQQSAQQAYYFENQIKELKKLHEQENIRLLFKEKEQESQLEKEKSAHKQVQRDLESVKQQSIKQQEESAQQNAQQAYYFENQIKELKKLQEQENKHQQDKLKEKESQLQKEKQEKAQLLRDLEAAKQQSIKQQGESAQKITQQADNLGNQIKELKKLSEQENKHQQDKLKEKEELIKNYQQQIEEKDSQIEQQNSLLEAQMNEQQQSIEYLNELKGGYDQSLKNNEQLQTTLKENQQIIEKQRQQNEEKDKQIGDSKNLLKQSMDKQKQLIDNLASSNSEFQKLQTLYNQSVQNNTNLENQLKEKDRQLIKEKQQNEEIIRNLQSSNQQLLQQQKETIQKAVNALSINSDTLSGERLNQQIKSVLTQLNPKADIQVNQVEFTKAHQIITQNQPNQKQKEVLQVKNDQIVQSYLNSLTNSQQNSRSSTATIDPMHCLLALQGLYKQDGINTFITDQPIQSLEGSDKTYKIQQAYLQTGLHDQASYYSVKLNKETYLYQDLVSSTANQNLSGFLESFKSRIAERVNSKNPNQDITIFKIAFDNVPQIDFQINSRDYNKEEFKRKMTLDDIGVSVSEKSLLEYAKLSVNMFSPSFNKKWTDEYKGKYESRGQLKFHNIQNPVNQHYYFPAGYSGYALNIDRYGEDKSWISQNADSKTWIVLFHGTSEKAVSGITKDNLRPGARNFYGGKKCRITNETIKEGPNANVYLTDNIDEAESYAQTTSTYSGKKYKIIFQCRVNPKGVKSPQLKPIYYTVEDNINIRPYRILLKEV